ncbi:MAG TPA: hypothetical protein VFQ43_02845 [Nitrososphaera sp.]|nr:hypothetical protein [Nitrososphaera sp.]
MPEIRFWDVLMICWVVFSSHKLHAQPAMDERIRVAGYYPTYYSKVYRVPIELVGAII